MTCGDDGGCGRRDGCIFPLLASRSPLALSTLRDTHLPRALARATANVWPDVVWTGPARTPDGARALYLTVDDGPDAVGTALWLRTLDRHDARALVFLSGPAVAARPDLARALADAGHRVGTHGGAHVSAWRTPPTRFLDAMGDAARALEDVLGAPVADVRPPYGRVTPGLVRWCRATGRRVVLWSLMPGDFLPSATPARLAADTVRLARPGDVAVFHDGRPAALATAALRLALPRLASAGWRFPALPAPTP
jgi:peptidoglycan/xylan/chitin deacetylase (PgdA/CDA1 family)